ncbi:MAG: asparagine synthase (glutamine-hydrolyzing) [Nautiliaceae bacterium]
MCGIYGFVGREYREIDFRDELRKRGPDGDGVFYDENITLGHTRLAILDLENASQPMEFDNLVIVFNGEIYNYKELREELKKDGYSFYTNSDTEVLLKGFHKWGSGVLERLRGMFAFCIYDKKNKKLFLARDRFGIKPLIYGFFGKRFVFSSELKPIFKSFLPKKLNYKALASYFRYGSISQPNTILDGFYFLMPGHFMEVDFNLNYKIKKYYDLVLTTPFEVSSYDEAIKLTRQKLQEATKYHLVSDVEVGAFLSGGVDSSVVVGLMREFKKDINTFSVGFSERVGVVDESEVAKRVAKFFSTKHHSIKINSDYVRKIFDEFILSLDMPSIDGINTFIVSKETSKKVKVAISGLGGDEIFGGYSHFKFIIQKKPFFAKVAKFIHSIKPNRFTNPYKFVGLDEFESVELQRSVNLEKVLKGKFNFEIFKEQNLTPLQKITLFEIRNYLLNTLLRDSDVLSMANSLELRPVLLDHKLVEFAFWLRDDFKIRDGRMKAVFVDAIKDLIPKEVYTRKKSGFEMPYVFWMNRVFNKEFLSLLEDKTLEKIFEKNYLENLKKRVKFKKTQRRDWMMWIFLKYLKHYKVEF